MDIYKEIISDKKKEPYSGSFKDEIRKGKILANEYLVNNLGYPRDQAIVINSQSDPVEVQNKAQKGLMYDTGDIPSDTIPAKMGADLARKPMYEELIKQLRIDQLKRMRDEEGRRLFDDNGSYIKK